ncbi:MAG: TetR/AcrR family transcriptional regulator [Candidatus Bathyarchaeia archaeon]
MAVTNVQRQRAKEATKMRILLAAGKEFARKGFDGASLNKIAALAGCSKPLVYRYFGSKNDLYRAVFTYYYSQLSKVELSHQCDIIYTSADKFLQNLLTDLFTFHLTHPLFAKLLAWENLAEASHIRPDEVKAAREPGFTKIKDMLLKNVAAGVIREDLDINKFVYMLQALVVVYFMNQYTMRFLTGFDFSSPDIMKDFIAFYAKVLSQGISASKEIQGEI